MKVKITRVEGKPLNKYKNVLNSFNANYHGEEDSQYAVIEIETIEELFNLSKKLKRDLIIDRSPEAQNEVTIFDDYL